MGTKNNPGHFDCYASAEPDEPMFILLGRDSHAPAAVRRWAYDREVMIERGEKPASDMAMVIEARECADIMDRYAAARRQKRPDNGPDNPRQTPSQTADNVTDSQASSRI